MQPLSLGKGTKILQSTSPGVSEDLVTGAGDASSTNNPFFFSMQSASFQELRSLSRLVPGVDAFGRPDLLALDLFRRQTSAMTHTTLTIA